MRRREVDVGIRAGKAHGEPFLALAAPTPAPYLADELGRQIVVQPVAALGEDLRLGRADLLLELAPRRLARALPFVDAALRHLPSLGLGVDTPGDEDLPHVIEQEDADAGAV